MRKLILLTLFALPLLAQTTRTHAVKSSCASFTEDACNTSLSAALSAEVTSGTTLTAGGRNIVLRFICYPMIDTTIATVQLFVTDATHYVSIEAQTMHAGVWNTGLYYMSAAPASNGVLTISAVDYVRITGIQVINTKASPSGGDSAFRTAGTFTSGANEQRLDRVILRGGNAVFYCYGINPATKIWNSLLYGGAYYGVIIGAGGSSMVISLYSSIVQAVNYGAQASGGSSTLIARNTYFAAATRTNGGTYTTCSGNAGTSPIAFDTLTGAGHAGFVNVTPGSEDFHIKSGSALIGIGTNTSGDAAPLNFTTDFMGYPRGSTWDIGASQYYVPPLSARRRVIQ